MSPRYIWKTLRSISISLKAFSNSSFCESGVSGLISWGLGDGFGLFDSSVFGTCSKCLKK
jgi:hypothetical protein